MSATSTPTAMLFAAPAVATPLAPPELPASSLSNEVRRKRWTRQEYYRLGEQGWFDDIRVELIDGEIIVVPPPGEPHYFCVCTLQTMLAAIFGQGCWVRSEACLAANDLSQPQPDIAVIEGPLRLLPDHPKTALLAVEISVTTQAYDKTTKAHLYASAGVPDYWVLDLERRDLTVFREPREDAASPFGWRYTQITVLDATQNACPLARPDAKLSVAEMLPPVAG